MIKKSALPDRVGRAVWPHVLRENSFKRADPATQLEISIAGDKQMQVIRHDDVATDSNVVPFSCAFGKINEGTVHVLGGENALSVSRATRHEICWPLRENVTEARWRLWISLHLVIAFRRAKRLQLHLLLSRDTNSRRLVLHLLQERFELAFLQLRDQRSVIGLNAEIVDRDRELRVTIELHHLSVLQNLFAGSGEFFPRSLAFDLVDVRHQRFQATEFSNESSSGLAPETGNTRDVVHRIAS